MKLDFTGLSRLSDAAAVLTGEDHYPVRRRGEKRRLNPNTAGIAWLDSLAAQASVPEPDAEAVYDDQSFYPEFTPHAGKPWIRAWKASGYAGGNLTRPMLQAFHVDKGGRGMGFDRDCCPDCYNFAYSHAPGDGCKPAVQVQVPDAVACEFPRYLTSERVAAWFTQSGTEVRWNPS